MNTETCEKHHVPLLHSPSTGVAYCLLCIEEMIEAHKQDAESIYEKLKASLSAPTLEQLQTGIRHSQDMMENSEAMAALRLIAAKAIRIGKTVDGVVEMIIKDDSIDALKR